MLERIFLALVLENPKNRVRWISPHLEMAYNHLCEKGLIDRKTGRLSREGMVARRIIREAKRPFYRRTDELWHSLTLQRHELEEMCGNRSIVPYLEQETARKTLLAAALWKLKAEGWIEVDPTYDKAEAWRWHP